MRIHFFALLVSIPAGVWGYSITRPYSKCIDWGAPPSWSWLAGIVAILWPQFWLWLQRMVRSGRVHAAWPRILVSLASLAALSIPLLQIVHPAAHPDVITAPIYAVAAAVASGLATESRRRWLGALLFLAGLYSLNLALRALSGFVYAHHMAGWGCS